MVIVNATKIFFVKKIPFIKRINIENINNLLTQIENYINYYVMLINKYAKENIMSELKLKKIEDLTHIKDDLNYNLSLINLKLNEFNNIISDDKLLATDIATIKNINFFTDTIKGSIEINSDNIKIEINNKVLKIDKDGNCDS